MRKAAWVFVSVCLAISACPLPAAVQVGERLPEKTHFAFWVDNLTEATEQAKQNAFVSVMIGEEGALGKDVTAVPRMLEGLPISAVDPLVPMWNEILPNLGASLRGGMESATSVFDFEPGEINKTFTRSLALYSTLYDYYIDDNIPIVEWDVILAADFEDADKEKVQRFLDKALARVPKDARKKTVSYSGHDVYHIEYFLDEQTALPGDDPVDLDETLVKEIPVIVEYAFVNNVFLLAEGRGEPLERAVRALTRDDPQFRLTSDPGYRMARETLGNAGQFHLYLNIPHHASEWRQWPSTESQARLVEALGFAEAGPIMINGTVNKDRFELDAVAVDPSEPKGLFALLEQSPENKMERLSAVPPDAKTFGSLSLDLEAGYNILRQVIEADKTRATPFLMMALQNIKNLTGVSIDQDLLPGSRGELISYLRPAATSPDAAESISASFVVPMNGSRETVDAFNKLITRISDDETMLLDVEAETLDGVTLWQTPEAVGAKRQTQGMYFAATPKGLVVATSGAELRTIVRRLAAPPEESVRNNAKVEAFLDALPREGLRGFAYMPAETLIADLERRGRLPGRMSNQKSGMLRDELTNSVGDIHWVLRAEHGKIRLTYQIAGPGE